MSVLAGIIEQRRRDVAARRRQRPLSRVEREVRDEPRSLAAALARRGRRFILEIKRGSPSEGILRSRFDPAAIAREYDGVADAISVLTEPHVFGGSPDHLRVVREQTSRPVLCKDFVVEPYQVIEARAAGADAILLMLSVLDDSEYRECKAAAWDAGMEVLTEVHDEAELARAITLEAAVIGINNRDLRTLATDLTVTERLAPLVPRGRLVVSESGIGTRSDVERLSRCARAFLVGSRLMRAPDAGLAARRLIHGDVKVCGLTRPEDARAAYRAGATMGGLVFAPESPRRVDERRAAEIRESAPLTWVGVFVNEHPELIAAIAGRLRLAAVQLHGEESAAVVSTLRPQLPEGCEIWKAIRVRDRLTAPTLADTTAHGDVDRLVLDGYEPAQRGGTGWRFDWSVLEPVADRSRIVLAGGLAADNARRALALGCGVLDVSSGVESAPGIKDSERLAGFVDALRAEP